MIGSGMLPVERPCSCRSPSLWSRDVIHPERLVQEQTALLFDERCAARLELKDLAPYYSTDLGDAYLGDAATVLQAVPNGSVNLVLTSPPYALHFKKEYGNAT